MRSPLLGIAHEDEALRKALQTESKLTAFFKLCQTDPFARDLLYADLPLYYWWCNNKWKRRKNERKSLTRLYHISPRDSERFHLKLLLQNEPGPTSFEDLLTNNAIISPSFKHSCHQRHLIADDSIWSDTIIEAANAGMPFQLTQMFAAMVLNCDISNPPQMWDDHRGFLREDHLNAGDSAALAEQKALSHIESVFRNAAKTLTDFGLLTLMFYTSYLMTSILQTLLRFKDWRKV